MRVVRWAPITENAVLPPCLCFGLSALIMLYAGIRKTADGYALPAADKEIEVWENETALRAFSRMSSPTPRWRTGSCGAATCARSMGWRTA